MTNPHPYHIPDELRSHRRRIEPGQETVVYTIKVPRPMRERLHKAGPVRVREKLQEISIPA